MSFIKDPGPPRDAAGVSRRPAPGLDRPARLARSRCWPPQLLEVLSWLTKRVPEAKIRRFPPSTAGGAVVLASDAMTDTGPQYPALSESDRQFMRVRLAEFEQTWAEGRLADFVQALPGAGLLRTTLLLELG